MHGGRGPGRLCYSGSLTGWWCRGQTVLGTASGVSVSVHNEGQGAKTNRASAGSLSTYTQHPAARLACRPRKPSPGAKTNRRQLEAKPDRAVPALGPKPKPKLNPHNDKLICPTTSQHERGWPQKRQSGYKRYSSMTRRTAIGKPCGGHFEFLAAPRGKTARQAKNSL